MADRQDILVDHKNAEGLDYMQHQGRLQRTDKQLSRQAAEETGSSADAGSRTDRQLSSCIQQNRQAAERAGR
jgi:hypothetical protein